MHGKWDEENFEFNLAKRAKVMMAKMHFSVGYEN